MIQSHLEFRITKNLTAKKLVFTGLSSVIASLVALGFSGSGAMAMGIKITGIATNVTNEAAPSTKNEVVRFSTSAGGLSSPSYNVTFAGDREAITTIAAGADVYSPVSSIPLTVFIRRNTAPVDGVNNTNSNIFYSPGSFTNGNPGTINVESIDPFSLTQAQVLGRNDINLGSDNLFTNTGNQINNNNIERVDFISSALGFAASDALAFSIIERGDGDSFKIAAITSLDAMGNPNGYGSLKTVVSGDYGSTLQSFTSIGFKDSQVSAANSSQNLIGLLIRSASDLSVTPGDTIFGFSLFAADTNSMGGSNLVDFTNTSVFFPTTTDTDGGLNLIAGNVGVVAVPFDFNPQLGVAILGGAWFIRRHLKKKSAK